MSARLRWEQCCDSDGCIKPAHIGSLCGSCFYAATPARRQVELDCQDVRDGAAEWAAARERRELEATFALPAVEPERRAA